MKEFKQHINQYLPFLKESKLLIAISGGIDSVVLAQLCKEVNLNFALAHCNFNLRGNESDADEAFVSKLGEELDVETFIQHFDTKVYASEHKLSIQMAARELRYDWFNELAEQLEFDYILTAHHADDNLETFLINFTRGTGLSGLTGIPMINDNIIRPLLPFSRQVIEAYAKENNINWREDSSNESKKYLRNKLRHDVVPILKEINPQLLDSFQNTLENLNDTADIVEESLNAVAKRAIVDIDNNGITFKVSEFKKVNNSKAYLFEMFKDYGFTEWNDVFNLLDAETGKYVTSNSHKLTKHRELLILSDKSHFEQSEYSLLISNDKNEVETPIGIISFKEVSSLSESTKNIIFIDKHKFKFPLELRLWQNEDIFYPSGMNGKKKVSKYLKDEKLKPSEKQNTWVLTSDDKIIWVVGMRADNRFKVDERTRDILKIELH
ncbi:tRNA lysidine(34) synthetase TilS [Winogradskyella sp. PC-19]|uniref:tRNA lysidine(34) synthetase TilS n=1 Tax=unclassified Winogradskyella TaxID=2615021 RepID=UPI000B3D167E|nr:MULTISPECIES: tRNA lysidine(34) synthetase TilS [unclassified Winogradskyella]ARV08809.1 tRNA lysidine(34) synthetase TilS [Winogradskyella sp. PC-19]RZN76850.1 MAG: tRNA lysidine(34) synthetase TilS [Winogradskyella sp.]